MRTTAKRISFTTLIVLAVDMQTPPPRSSLQIKKTHLPISLPEYLFFSHADFCSDIRHLDENNCKKNFFYHSYSLGCGYANTSSPLLPSI
jgi:hypothetical protein